MNRFMRENTGASSRSETASPAYIAGEDILLALSGLGVGTGRLGRAAAAAAISNPWDLPAMASPPTWAGDGTSNSALTKAYALANLASDYSILGGKSLVIGSSLYVQQCTLGTISGGAAGGNISGGPAGANGTDSAIDFMTDALTLQFQMFYAQQPRVQVNGQYVSKSLPTNSGGGSATYMHLDFTSLGRTDRRITLELSNSPAFYGVNVAPTESIWATPKQDVIRSLWIGDSITLGVGVGSGLSPATDTTWFFNSYAHVAAKKLGWRSVQKVAIGGTGYLNPGSFWPFDAHVSDVNLAQVDVVVIAGGINDGGYTPALIQAAAAQLYKDVRSRLPGVPIFVLGSFDNYTGPSPTIITTEQAIAAAVASMNDSLMFFIPVDTASTPWAGAPNASLYLPSSQSPHPNAAGHELYGSRTATGISSALYGTGL